MLRQTFFFGDSMTQRFHGLSQLRLGTCWKELVGSVIFSLLSSFSSQLPYWNLIPFICLCFFKTPNQANVHCSSVPTGDQSLSYIHGLPRKKLRDWSSEQMERVRSDQPEVGILRVCELFSIVDEGVLSNWLFRKLSWGVHRNSSDVPTELLTFLPPSISQIQWVSKMSF